MEQIKDLIDIVLHLNKYLDQVIADYGVWTHLILFAIIFCETGLVVTPFLPGDSLLFVAGTFAASGTALNLWGVLILLSVAAILGDAVNYSIGYFFGPRLCGGGRFIKKEYLDRTHRFYEKYGKMTIILARFVPIVRTFAPFLAGVGSMRYVEFAAYNVIGGLLWVGSLTLLGYFFGNFEVVQKNFSMVIMAIIVISVLPMVVEYWRHRKDAKTEPPTSGEGESV